MEAQPTSQRRPSSDFVLLDERGSQLVSNNEATSDFVLVVEEPTTKRRELRASKELDEVDRMALTRLVATAADQSAADETADTNDSEDESGIGVAPSPQRRPSFKNGRRVSGEAGPLQLAAMQRSLPSSPAAKCVPDSPSGVEDLNMPAGSLASSC